MMRISFSLLPALVFGKHQVYISRHCIRATAHDNDISAYTAYPMVDWGVPTNWCTERGMEIMKATGKDLVDNFGVDPTHVRFYSDTVMRDGDTAFAMMMGMGMQHATVDYDAVMFSATHPQIGSPVCEEPDEDIIAAERRTRADKVPLPADYKAALAELQDIIGVGPAGRLEDIDGPDAGVVFDSEGRPTGAANIMKLFGQAMLYAYASGRPFLNATDEQINKFIAWQYWFRSAADVNSGIATANAFLLRHILDDLKSGSGTSIYLGHDDNMDGIAAVLGLRWDGPPYAPLSAHGELLPTPPGSGLLFEYDEMDSEGAVNVSFVYRVFNTSDAEFALSRTDVAQMGSVTDFEQTMLRGLQTFEGAAECFGKASPVVV